MPDFSIMELNEGHPKDSSWSKLAPRSLTVVIEPKAMPSRLSMSLDHEVFRTQLLETLSHKDQKYVLKKWVEEKVSKLF